MPHKRINAPLVTGLMLAVLVAPFSAQAAEERAEEPTNALTDALTDAGADPLPGVFTLGEIEVSGNAEDNKNTTVEKITAEELRDFDRQHRGRRRQPVAGRFLHGHRGAERANPVGSRFRHQACAPLSRRHPDLCAL